LPSLSACGGVGRSNSDLVPQGANAPLAADSATREAQSDSIQLAAAPLVASSSDLLYVGNGGNNSITIYHHDASGDTAPLAIIKGSKTKLNGPSQLSEDASGDLYVTNAGGSSILVFKHGANGDVAPLRVIAGARTGLSAPNYLEAVTVDQTTGKIFAMVGVAVSSSNPNGNSELLRFPPNASGDEAPFAASGVGLNNAYQLASDSTGTNIIDASFGYCCSVLYWGSYTYAKQFANGANPGTVYQIYDFQTAGVADDPTTKSYLVSGWDGNGGHRGIFRFKEDTVGYGGADFGGTPKYTPPVVSIITSDTCGAQLALGYERNIYVAHSKSGSCASDAVYVYEHDASGNAKPLRILSGSATKLDGPVGIYEGL
jgi:hypothetical protein